MYRNHLLSLHSRNLALLRISTSICMLLQPRTHQPAVGLLSWPFSHSQLTSSLVALRVLGGADSALMGSCYMEGCLLQAPLQCVMMLPHLFCSQEEQPNLPQSHAANNNYTQRQTKNQIFSGLCTFLNVWIWLQWLLCSVIMSNPKPVFCQWCVTFVRRCE